MSSLLETVAFRQPRRAQGEIAAVAGDLDSTVQRQLELLLASSADPDGAIHCLASFKQQHPETFRRLAQSPIALQSLIAVFSYSRFLSAEIQQNPQWMEQLAAMDRVLLAPEYKQSLIEFLSRQ